ncbi:MAG: ABC transporter ATP-binding protein [Desulfotignum sp.]|nr:ABC transporter ATP-binding protein [Desulfotignum sp.]
MTLDIRSVSAGYGRTPVITDIHMTAAAGRICAVMGRNGSGKTTLLRCINHVLPPLKGEIRIMGQDISCLARHRIMALMRKLAGKRNMTVIITLHDPNLTYHYCDDVVLIHQGRVAAAGKTVDTLTSEVLTQVLGDNIRLDVTTSGVRVAVPRTFDLNRDTTKPSL